MAQWLDDLFSNKEIAKEASQTDASQEWERKVKANDWIKDVMETDVEALEKEAAHQDLTTPEEVIEEDRERQVKALSNKALAEALAEYRLQGKGLPENFSEEKEKAEKKVDSDREAAEKELLKFVGEHSQLDWKASFEKWSKAEPEHTEAKDLESDEFKAGKQNWEKKAPEFEPTKEEVKEQMDNIGHEEEKKAIDNEKLLEEQRKEASLEKKADDINRHRIQTKNGNYLEFFYNPENNLVVVDLIAANEEGGNEILRQTLDESSLLGHTAKKEASLEIENHASKADVLKKVAEVQSPWQVIKDAEGNEVIARIETEKTVKESEEEKNDLQK